MAKLSQPASEHLRNALQTLVAEINLSKASGELTFLADVRDSVAAALDAVDLVKETARGGVAYRTHLAAKELL